MHNEFVSIGDDATTQHLLNAMLEILHDSGFRITEQRKLILEAIAYQVGWHVHPKDVFAYAHKKDTNIGLATVYRTIKMLDDMDLLNKVYLMGKQDIHPDDHGYHYHLVCLRCGSIEDTEDDLLDQISTHVKTGYGFTPTQIKTTIYGLCEDCKQIAE